MAYDIFVSYRRSDRELVAQVVSRLEKRGVTAWYDARIEGGADWREDIVEALTDSTMLVIFFSEPCNASRQLKKELAVADSLAKAVVPILIEDTTPKGAYLYELADRNWIQAWPDPASKVDELVEHLAALVDKPSGAAPPAESIAAASAEPAPTSRLADAYVGKVSDQRRKKAAPTRDILPFKWIDLVFLAPLLGGLAWYLKRTGAYAQQAMEAEWASIGLLCLILVALYGAVVFPFRYYLRRRTMGAALVRYLISTGILYLVFVGAFGGFWMQGYYPNDTPSGVALFFGAVWGVFTAIAFVIYAVLSGQRALRSFRSNIKRI